ncbi:MAG TPA: AMP-binding protein [Elusimicrobiota bacterium]|nr:AMP-binding protein [Elusimicrobiota bacterium]
MNLSLDLDRAAERHAGRVALAYPGPDGRDAELTYARLAEKIRRAAAAFAAAGIGPGDCVAILHRNDPAFVVAYFGLIRIGAVAVPVNFMIQNAAELGYILGHCGARGAVTQKEFLPGLFKAKASLPALARVWSTDGGEGTEPFWPFVEAAAPSAEAPRGGPDETAMILYTSGTTGNPKGVMLTHANLVSNCAGTAEALLMSAEDAVLAVLPMFHTFAWTVCVLTPLRLGATVIAVPAVAPPDPWLAQVGRRGATVVAMVPQLYVLLASAAAGYRGLILAEGCFHGVRLCISGGAPLSPQVHADFMDAFGLEIVEGYGLTETSPVAAITPPGASKVGSVGPAIPGVSLRVLDENGRELGRDEEGEIFVKGPNVMKGYLKDEAATREILSPDGWLRTGDIGLIDAEGYLHIRDRVKDMIIVKGLKVFSAQVEKTLLACPLIQEAAVIGVPDETQDEWIKAFVVLKKGAAFDQAALLRFCRENFDPYKRPREVEIVDSLPKNALQKTLKRVLRQRELDKRRPAAA